MPHTAYLLLHNLPLQNYVIFFVLIGVPIVVLYHFRKKYIYENHN